MLDTIVKDLPGGVTILVKVVPGASRSRVAGVLGDRLKLQVSAPPEAGKANAAVCVLIAEVLGIPVKAVRVAQGQTQPRKQLHIEGVEASEVVAVLRGALRR